MVQNDNDPVRREHGKMMSWRHTREVVWTVTDGGVLALDGRVALRRWE